MADTSRSAPISWICRLYIYAIHGYVTEIMFTAAWEFIAHLNWKFPGNTSIWSLLIYGLSAMVIEKMYLHLHDRVPLLVRAVIYTAWLYVWEFSMGWILKQFDACPWDYTEFDGNFMGLVTLEYAPFWFSGVILAEQVVIKWTRQLHWGGQQQGVEPGVRLTPCNGDVKHRSD